MTNITKEAKIARCLATFETAVLKHSEFMFKDSSIANHHFGVYKNALKELSELGDCGLSALARLLDSDNTVVRVTTASYLIHFCTDKALTVLRKAKKLDRGIAMLAEVTIRRWELGRYLDPASGREVQLNPRGEIDRPETSEESTHPSSRIDQERWSTFIDLLRQPLESLDEVQRPAALAFQYDGHVRNGGHSSHFDSKNAVYDDELIQALRHIGAHEQARILAEARLLNREASEAKGYEQESLWEMIADLDQKFYHLRPSIEEILVKYFNANKSHFPS